MSSTAAKFRLCPDGLVTQDGRCFDQCADADTVIEYYCLDASSPAEVLIACPNGCATDANGGAARCN